ncbi:hypothetical protein MHU86_7684 [Fragilaria crotonensis]|nr:hypothetical protein MHU86_7684 [Fragilaria crotonensis]
MTFSLSKCPPKPRTKSSGRKSIKNVYHEKAEKKSRDVGGIASMIDALEGSPACRKRRRRRTSDYELPIPSFEAKTALFDLSLLDSPLDKVKQPPTNMETTTSELATMSQCRNLLAEVETPGPNSAEPFAADFDDSDDELLQSSAVFQKVNNLAENPGECCETRPEIEEVEDPVNEQQPNVSPVLDAATSSCCHNETNPPKHLNAESNPQIEPLSKVSKAPVSKDQLFLSLDNLCIHADINSVTVKDIIEALEAEFETALDRKTRRLVKNRLTDLISRKVIPMVASTPENTKDEGRTPYNEMPLVHLQDAEATSQKAPAIDQINKQRHLVSETRSIESIQETEVKRSLSSKPTEEASNNAEEYAAVESATGRLEKYALPVVPVEPTGDSKQLLSKGETTQQSSKVKTSPAVAVADRSSNPEAKVRVRRRKIHGDDGALPPPAPPKESRKRTRKGTCALCTTCSCINDKDTVLDTPGKVTLARTDLAIEKALIKRQKKLEQAVDKHESDLDLVSRELKRHRRAILKRRNTQLGDGTIFNGCRFLPDVDVWDSHLENINRGVVSCVDVRKSQRKMFGKLTGGQPTLTQMMGVERADAPGLETITEEKSANDMSQASETLNVDDGDEEGTSSQPDDSLEEPAEPVQRITWRDGKTLADDKDQQPIWSLVASGKFESGIHGESGWDQIFANRMLPDADDGFDELLGLFGADPTCDARKAEYSNSEAADDRWPSESVNLSQLSQSAQEIAATLECKVTADLKRLSRIEKACPNWKENVRFALHQRTEDDISIALDNIRASRARLDKMKEEFVSALQRQQTVLQLFEMTLSASLKRANGEEFSVGAHFEASTDVESDAETVTEFSPLSQDETKWSPSAPCPTVLVEDNVPTVCPGLSSN